MSLFGDSIKTLAQRMQTCEEWLELVRDLQEPIDPGTLPPNLGQRWAEPRDLFAINALQGFIEEPDAMAAALAQGDRCLVLTHQERIVAFAWVTFSDVKLALWYTLRLPPDDAYLVFIVVHPEFAGAGVGTTLLGALMHALRDQGCRHLIAGMYSNWHPSIRMHTRMGFRTRRRLTQCRWLNIFPTPPKTA